MDDFSRSFVTAFGWLSAVIIAAALLWIAFDALDPRTTPPNLTINPCAVDPLGRN